MFYIFFCTKYFFFITTLSLHHLPHHTHASVEVDFHEVGAGRVRGEVECWYGLHRLGGRRMPRLHKVGEFAALKVVEFNVLVVEHITADGGLAARRIWIEVDFALALVKIVRDVCCIIGDKRFSKTRVMIKSEHR